MIYNTFHTNNLDLEGRKLIIGVSGGVDSMVLLHLCHRIDAEITVVHVNYGLRGDESDGDEAFTHEYCKGLGIECHVTCVNAVELKAKGVNLQQRAREIRYRAYFECLSETQSDLILTAHHRDDSVETVVMNFFRGTDLNGLTGIKEYGQFRRPLLPFTKSEIREYADANGVAYRVDKSNASDDYTRNFIRNTLLPQLDKTFPNINQRLLTTIDNLSAASTAKDTAMSYLVRQFERVSQEGQHERLLPFMMGDDAALELPLLIYWGRLHGMSRAQMQLLYTVRNLVGKKVQSNHTTISIDREGYLLYETNYLEQLSIVQVSHKGFYERLPGTTMAITDDDTHLDQSVHSLSIDLDRLSFPLKVRYWEDGDRIVYSKAPRLSKKLKKLFNDHKVKSTDKHRIPILVNGDGEIILVVGLQQNPEYAGDGRYQIIIVEVERE